jgi:hypothetical protein
MNEFIKQLKTYLKDNKENFVNYVEVETSFGYLIDTEEVDMDKLNNEIDKFCESFKGDQP